MLNALPTTTLDVYPVTHTHSHASTPPPRTTSTHATSTHPHPQSIHPTIERVRVRAQMATPSYVSVAALLHMPTCACTCAIVSQTFMRAKHVGSVTHSVAQAPAHRFGHALETFVFATMLAETGPRAPRGQHWVAASKVWRRDAHKMLHERSLQILLQHAASNGLCWRGCSAPAP